MPIPDALTRFAVEARAQAQALGMDPGPIEFRIADPERIYELAAYALPVRIPHWTHGRDYWRMKQHYEQGGRRLYEIIFAEHGHHVAYLLEGNSLAAQKLVIAHCQGHADMDAHNLHLRGQAEAVEQIRLGAHRMMRLTPDVGASAVEWILDRALTIQAQVAETTPHPMAAPSRPSLWDGLRDMPIPSRIPNHPWPTPDLLGFIARESRHLTDWERDICAITRREGLYFNAFRSVQMLHEAWATWANQRILLATDHLTPGEQLETVQMFAHVIAPSRLRWNPYALGYPLLDALIAEHGFETIRDLWYTGTDTAVLRDWLTEPLVRRLHLFAYEWADRGTAWEALRQPRDWERIRDTLANELSVRDPRVVVERVSGGVLHLRHDPDGTTCDRTWAQRATQAVADLWGAPVRFADGEWVPLTANPTPKPHES